MSATPISRRPEQPTLTDAAIGESSTNDGSATPVERTLVGEQESGGWDADLTQAGTLPPNRTDSPATIGGPEFVVADSPDRSAPQSARSYERYQVQGEIARGGMGAILKGRDTTLRRELALKVLLESHVNKPAVVQRFVEEAQISGRLQHPGVVPVYELGTLPDHRPYFSMKLVQGETLAVLLAQRSSPADDRGRLLGIFEQVCQTLAYAHSQAVIHRDLKPANVMVGEFGEVQVMDWGLAKTLGATVDGAAARADAPAVVDSLEGTVFDSGSIELSPTGSHTVAGSVMGTPAYMPPEQARGDLHLIDERADVFGLGAILCEILTGKPAHTGANGVEVLKNATLGDLSACHRRLNTCDADPELISLAIRCLAADPADRPRNAGIVARQITEFLESVAQRLHVAEVERAAEAARAEEAQRTAAEHEAAARAERRARRLQFGLAAAVLSLTTVAGVVALWAAVHQSALKQELARENQRAVAAREAEAKHRELAEIERRRADLTLSDMLTSRGLLAAEKHDAAQAALWFSHAAAQSAAAEDPERYDDNRLRSQNWLRESVAPVGVHSFEGSPTSLSFQTDGDFLLMCGDGRGAVWNWREDRLLSIPALDHWVSAARFSPDGALLAIAHAGAADVYTGLGVRFDPRKNTTEIIGVVPGGGAADVGLEAGDVVESIDGVHVAEPAAMGVALRGKQPGDSVEVTVSRRGATREYTIPIKRLIVPVNPGQNASAPVSISQLTLWSAIEGEVVAQIPLESFVGALAFSPDGRLLAVGESDVRIWDLENQRFLPGKARHPRGVGALVFTERGDRLITACDDKQARVFTVGAADERSAPLFAPVPHAPVIPSAPALIDDERTLLTITGESSVGVWSMQDGKSASGGAVAVRPRSLARVVASGDGRWFVTGGNYGPELRFASDPRAAGVHFDHVNFVRDIAFSPDGTTLATVSWDQTARFWTVPDGRSIGSPLAHPGAIEACAWSSDGVFFATGQGDGLVRVWRRTGAGLQTLAKSPFGQQPRLSSDGTLLAPGLWHEAPSNLAHQGLSRLQVLRSFDAAHAGPAIELPGALFDSCIAGDNASVAAVCLRNITGVFGVWDVASGGGRFDPVDLPAPAVSVTARPGTSHVAILCTTGQGMVFDSQTGDVAYEFRHEHWNIGTDDRVVRIAYSPDGESLVTLGPSFGNTIEVRDAQNGRLRFAPIVVGGEASTRCRSLAFSRDGRMLATAVNGRNAAQVWDLATGQALSAPLPHPGDYYGLFCLCFSPDGNHLLTGCKDGQARYWDWRTGVLACPSMSHGDEVYAVAITPDGRRAAAAVRGPTHPVRLWELKTGKPVAPAVQVPAPAEAFLSSIVVTPDGRRAVAAAHTAALSVIDLATLTAPTTAPLAVIERSAELASGIRIELGDVSSLSRDAWQERWNALDDAEKRRLASPTQSMAPLDPGAAGRSDQFAREGRWKLAARAALQELELLPDSRISLTRCAPRLILAGDAAAYRRFCARMAERFGKTASGEEADSTCKSCLLLPDCVAIETLPIQALERALETNQHGGGFTPWGGASLALVKYRQGDWERAEALCLRGLEFDRRSGQSAALSLCVLALARLQLGKSVEAQADLRDASRLIPAELATLGTREFRGPLPVSGEVIHHDWLVPEILRREAARLILGSTAPPPSEQSLRERVNELLVRNDLDALKALLRSAAAADPTAAWVHDMLGRLHASLGEADEAAAAYRAALAVDPDLATAHSGLAVLQYEQGDFESALAGLRRAVEIEPESPRLRALMGRVLMHTADFREARECFDKALELAPQEGSLIASRAAAERLERLQPKLSAFVDGSLAPQDAAERLDVVQLCIAERRFAAAARFSAAALADDPKLADDPTNGLRYNAACSAARAISGEGDGAVLDESERSQLRRQAIEWLEAERSRFADLLANGLAEQRPELLMMLRHWPKDRDLVALRQPELLAELPEEESARLSRFWSDVARMLGERE